VIVVADTSVLLNLCRVEQVELLPALFREVVVPPEVASEFAQLARRTPRFAGLALPPWLRQQSTSVIPDIVRSAAGLDAGEVAALALAVEIHADAILVDERRGHEVALQLGLRAIGVLGILLQAKANGLLPLVAPALDRLERDAGFWMTPALRARVMRSAGEGA